VLGSRGTTCAANRNVAGHAFPLAGIAHRHAPPPGSQLVLPRSGDRAARGLLDARL
jgi:hypothetical protein